LLTIDWEHGPLCRSDYVARYPEALRELSKWVSEGRIIRKYHVVEGLESAPKAFPLLFTGGNTGKLLVSVSLTVSIFAALTQSGVRVVRVSGLRAKI
jgi:hypothetical protein